MNVLKNLKKTNYCPICKNKNFKNLGKTHNLHNNLDNFIDLIKCSSCKHCCLSLMPDQNLLDELYKQRSDYVFANSKIKFLQQKNYIEKKMEGVQVDYTHWVYQYLKNLKPGIYLEVGPGNCVLFKTFKSSGWYCEGYELWGWIKSESIYHDYDAIPKNHKDVIVMHDVLEHVVDPTKFLKKFSILQKKSGKLFLSFPNADSLRAKLFKSKWRMVVPLTHINFFSKESTKKLLENCGYEPIYIKPVSLVVFRKLIRSIIRLPMVLILDLIKFDFRKAIKRIPEILVNCIDLISGDQIKVIAVKK